MATTNNNDTTTSAHQLELFSVKALFVQRQYRQCIQACREILKNADHALVDQPAQRTFLSFYEGSAHDEIGRLMHDCSQAKVAAFAQAEQHYQEALKSLAIVEAQNATVPELPVPVSGEADPFFDCVSERASSPDPPAPCRGDEYDLSQDSNPSLPSLPPTSLQSHTKSNSVPTRSLPAVFSHMSSISDTSDLASRSKFHRTMSPHKMLPRDISRMSLLDDSPPKRPTGGLPRTTTTGLLKPIRPGIPPKAFNAPPQLPDVGVVKRKDSRLPKLVPRSTQETTSRPVSGTVRRHSRLPLALPKLVTHITTPQLPRKQDMPRAMWDEEEPDDPVSPMGSDCVSLSSEVSPVSPDTPRPFETHNTTLQEDVKTQETEYHPPSTHSRDISPESASVRDCSSLTSDLETKRASESPPSVNKTSSQPHISEHHVQDARVSEHLSAMRTQLENHLATLACAKQAALTAQGARISKLASADAPTLDRPLTPLPVHTDGSVSGRRSRESAPSRVGSGCSNSNYGSTTEGESKHSSSARSYWSFASDQDQAEERHTRVQAARDRRWVRERFRAERYQVLAEKALAEL